MARLNVNGGSRDFEAEADTPLLWVLREQLGLTGTKYGCGIAHCGACTVHIDGVPTRSCVRPASTVDADAEDRHDRRPVAQRRRMPLQKAWVALDVPQCGFCQSGMIMAAAALLKRQAQADRCRHRRRDDQHLPLRHLQPRARGDQAVAAQDARRPEEAHMSTTTLTSPRSVSPPPLPRARPLPWPALVVGFHIPDSPLVGKALAQPRAARSTPGW